MCSATVCITFLSLRRAYEWALVRTKSNLPIQLASSTPVSIFVHYPLTVVPILTLITFTHWLLPPAGGRQFHSLYCRYFAMCYP